MSSRGGIQVARQRIQVGVTHAGKTVTIDLTETTLRVSDQHGKLLATVPRNSGGEVTGSRPTAHGNGVKPAGFPDRATIRQAFTA